MSLQYNLCSISSNALSNSAEKELIRGLIDSGSNPGEYVLFFLFPISVFLLKKIVVCHIKNLYSWFPAFLFKERVSTIKVEP